MSILGWLMKNGFPVVSNPGPPIPAGYTYFGQFVDHDITRDDTRFEQAGSIPPGKTPNAMGPWLDLNQLYGAGPSSDKDRRLYNGASFHLGGDRVNEEQFDVPLDDKQKPLLADDRNGENLIIRQLHAMFLKLHNLAVRELDNVPEEGRFDLARRKVRWQYQWLIRKDYLLRICCTEVYKDVVENGNPIIDWNNQFSIPVEFSQAAFRFGHSMVRDDYKLNRHQVHFPLQRLFTEAHNYRNIDAALAIDWEHFTRREPSMAIDTTIVPALYKLRPDYLHHLVADALPPQPSELPIRTLCRGAATELPTGEEISCALGRKQLREERPDLGHWAMLDAIGLGGRTPLWFYVLLEAASCEDGNRLGYVGSRIVAEVLEGSLRADPESFLNQCPPSWQPPRWRAWNDQEVKIEALHDIAKAVGLSKERTPRVPL